MAVPLHASLPLAKPESYWCPVWLIPRACAEEMRLAVHTRPGGTATL